MADFDIPVDDFEVLRALIEAGDLSAAEALFRELTKVPAKDAEFFVGEMAESGASQSTREGQASGKGTHSSVPDPDAEPVYTTIPLPPVPAKPATADSLRPKVPASLSPAAKTSELDAESAPEPEFSSIVLPSKPASASASASLPSVDLAADQQAVPSAFAPAKPPVSNEDLVNSQLEKAAAHRKTREIAPEVDLASAAPRWYELMLPFLAIPLVLGGLIGCLFCALGFFLAYLVVKSSALSRVARRCSALLVLLGSYAGYVATIYSMTGTFSLSPSTQKYTSPDPIEPSSTTSWNSPIRPQIIGGEAELEKIYDLYYRPLDALPAVTTTVEDSTLTVFSEKIEIDSALTGIPLLDRDRDLVADLGRGNSVTLISYALRLPSDDPDAPLRYLDAENPEQKARESFRKIPASKHRKRPVLRCVVRLKRVSKTDVTFHLYDAQTQRKVASARPSETGEVDFQLGIWHRTPLIMVVEANAFASSASGRHRLPVGEDVKLGMGRAQVAYLGPGHLDGVKNGATIESGKPYRLVRSGKGENSAMVILRYAPPYLANSTRLLMTATKDHLVSAIPAFGDFELEPVGPDGDLLGFRVFHLPSTIDNQLYGDGLQGGNSPGAQSAIAKVERRVDLSSDFVSASFDSQRGRGLIAMDEIPGMQSTSGMDNLFDLKVPLLVFEESDPLPLLLQFAADAVQFDLEEIDDEIDMPKFQKTIEYTGLSPKQALLDFEQLSGIRVLVDSDQRRISLQP